MAVSSRSIQSNATSSASSSGYTTTSHNKLNANGNTNRHFYLQQQQQQQQHQQYNDTSGKIARNGHQDHQQVAAARRRHHLHLFNGNSQGVRALRANAVAPPQLPMVPMMIDDELDDVDVEEDIDEAVAELMIDDDIEPTDSTTDQSGVNNNISAYPLHSVYKQRDCADSIVYQQQQQQPQYLQLDHRQQNGLHHLQPPNTTTRGLSQQQQQQQQLEQQRLSNANLYNHQYSQQQQQQQLAVYHQPHLTQYLQYNQQRINTHNNNLSYNQPLDHRQPVYTSVTDSTSSAANNDNLFSSYAHQRSINGSAQPVNNQHFYLEKSSCESSDERTSHLTGSKQLLHQQQQVSHKQKSKKMVPSGSRQHLTPTADSHHQRHHNQQQQQQQQQHYHSSSGKRKNANHRSKQTFSSKQLKQVTLSETKLSCCGKMAKLLLFISNISFWSAGIALGAWGILSLVEDHKYNLSQLLVFEPNSRMSLFQLLAWSFITLGCATVLVGFCGCSAILKNNRWILGLYIFLILAIFALDLATGLLAIIFQEKLVANVRLRLVNKLRTEYGVQASFTAALDYIQTKYECCGLEGHFDYDQSLWRLQRLGGFEATVARTCCHLRNSFDDQAHINPRPVNESMCQSTDVRFHQSYRYRKGCLDDLERLIRQKIWTFTIGCGAVGAVILLSLLFATCFCRSIPGNNSRKNSAEAAIVDSRQHQSNHLEHKKQPSHHGSQVEMHHSRHYR